MRSVWGRIAGTTAARVYSMGLSIVALSLTARLLGPEGRGQVAAVLGWVAAFSTLGHLSAGQVAIYRATERKDPAWFASLVGSLVAIAAAVALTGWLVAAAMQAATGGGAFGHIAPHLLAIGFLMLPFLVWEQYGRSLLMSLDRLDRYNHGLVAGRTLALLALLVLVGAASLGPEGALAAGVLGQVVTSLVGSRVIGERAGGRVAARWDEVRGLLGGCLRLHPNAVGAFMFTSTGVLVVNHYLGAEQAGYYQLAVQLIGVLLIVSESASMVLYGRMSALGPEEAWPLTRRVLGQAVLLVSALAAVAWFAAPWLVRVVAGDRFVPTIELFQLMLPTLVSGTVSTTLAAQWIGRGLFWQASALTLTVGVLSLGAAIVLTPTYGARGAVIALYIGHAAALLVNAVFAAHCERSYRRRAAQRETT